MGGEHTSLGRAALTASTIGKSRNGVSVSAAFATEPKAPSIAPKNSSLLSVGHHARARNAGSHDCGSECLIWVESGHQATYGPRVHIRALIFAAVFGSQLISAASRAASDVNRPLAQAQIQSVANFDRVHSIVEEFSRESHFAVQVLPAPQPSNTDFSVRLFRDDLTVTINKVRGGPIDVAAFPLCACELNRRFGLQEAAEAAVNELKRDLSAQ